MQAATCEKTLRIRGGFFFGPSVKPRDSNEPIPRTNSKSRRSSGRSMEKSMISNACKQFGLLIALMFALAFGPARADDVLLGGNDVVPRPGVDGATGVIFIDL